ncbi:MAG: hypothetical protein P4M05_35560 [Bradyrhizobium sp.]|nr:hypothetical protein [Bradyrhizobium sp.]
MIDKKFARLRTHRDNIRRYRRLLKTELTELERQFIENRLSEERFAMENVAASASPLTLQIPVLAIKEPPTPGTMSSPG